MGKLGQLSTMTGAVSGTTTYTYDANGNETGITNPNTTTVTKGYDNANRLTSVTNKNSSGTVLSSYTITPNADSQVTGISESGGSAVTYGYDALGHLTSDVRTGTNAYSKSYTVDGEGNRTGMTVGGTSSTFNYNNDDWLTSTTGGLATSYGYDNAGEQTSRTVGGVTYTLAYDYEGQLLSITHSSTTVSFTYDALGRRMSRTSGGTTTNFLYDGGQVQLEAQGSTITSVYSYGNSLTRKDGEFPMFDGHGSERTVTNSSQSVTGTLNLDAFGVQAGSTGSSTDPYMYAATSGYRNDGDAGLTLDGARYYDAAVGRFITRDTDLSQAPYCYCDGDPVNMVDEDGHDPIYLPVQPTQTGHGPIGTGTQEPPPGSQPDPFGPPPYGVQPPPEHKPWPPTDPGGINQSGPGGTFGWGGGKLKVTLPKGGGASGTYTHPFSGNGGNGTWGLGGYYDGHGGGAIGIGISWSG